MLLCRVERADPGGDSGLGPTPLKNILCSEILGVRGGAAGILGTVFVSRALTSVTPGRGGGGGGDVTTWTFKELPGVRPGEFFENLEKHNQKVSVVYFFHIKQLLKSQKSKICQKKIRTKKDLSYRLQLVPKTSTK